MDVLTDNRRKREMRKEQEHTKHYPVVRLIVSLTDGDGGDGDAFGHLDDGVEGVHPREHGRLNRHADHRQRRQRRHHTRKVRRPARTRDDHLCEAGKQREDHMVRDARPSPRTPTPEDDQ
jgi:hypothetical protein